MKSIFAILLASVLFAESLLPKGIGMEQSFKMSELVSHFNLHYKASKGNLSFSDFLWMHYSADSSHKKNNKHNNLPNFDSNVVVAAVVLPTISQIDYLPIHHFVEALKNITFYKNSYSFLFSLDLLNPPQR